MGGDGRGVVGSDEGERRALTSAPGKRQQPPHPEAGRLLDSPVIDP